MLIAYLAYTAISLGTERSKQQADLVGLASLPWNTTELGCWLFHLLKSR